MSKLINVCLPKYFKSEPQNLYFLWKYLKLTTADWIWKSIFFRPKLKVKISVGCQRINRGERGWVRGVVLIIIFIFIVFLNFGCWLVCPFGQFDTFALFHLAGIPSMERESDGWINWDSWHDLWNYFEGSQLTTIIWGKRVFWENNGGGAPPGWKGSGRRVCYWRQLLWLCILSCRQFERTFEKGQRRKVKQMQPM